MKDRRIEMRIRIAMLIVAVMAVPALAQWNPDATPSWAQWGIMSNTPESNAYYASLCYPLDNPNIVPPFSTCGPFDDTAEVGGPGVSPLWGMDPQFVDDLLQHRYYSGPPVEPTCCDNGPGPTDPPEFVYNDDIGCHALRFGAEFTYDGPPSFTIENAKSVFAVSSDEFTIHWDFLEPNFSQVGHPLDPIYVSTTAWINEGEDHFVDNGEVCLEDRIASYAHNPYGGPIPGLSNAAGEMSWALWYEPKFSSSGGGYHHYAVKARYHLSIFITSATPNNNPSSVIFAYDYLVIDYTTTKDVFDNSDQGTFDPTHWDFNLSGVYVMRTDHITGKVDYVSIEHMFDIEGPSNGQKFGLVRTPPL